jgi:ribonucleoside-diphosphate reductase alpha chain
MFIDDSACNLASLNLLKFWRDKSRTFDVAGFQGAIRALVIAQDLIVDYAGYPTPEIAKNSARLRPLGLGFANLGALLMTMGLPYDSDAARSWASAIASLLSSTAYQVSAEMASSWGAFAEFEINRKPFASVIEAHAQASESINWRVLGESQSAMQAAASSSWKAVRAAAQASGFRNAQVTAIAPTGTIGFMMDCDTTGIEPEFSLVKVKKLVGGGEMRLVNQCVSRSLLNLGYSVSQAEAITQHVRETGAVEGAPSIRPQHLRVFDCALSSSPNGAISSIGHLKMMAAVQPFISGAISKTVNLPSSATPEGVAEVYWQAWKMGLKAVSIYRDRSKIVQPLNLPSANPPCSLCGHETRLEGGCFICSNCGQTTACG